MENSVYGSLIRCLDIVQPERHDYPSKRTKVSRAPEGYFMDVLFGNKYLVITRVTIHKGKYLMPRCCIDLQVGNWHMILVL